LAIALFSWFGRDHLAHGDTFTSASASLKARDIIFSWRPDLCMDERRLLVMRVLRPMKTSALQEPVVFFKRCAESRFFDE
jgi:hypothetical protein